MSLFRKVGGTPEQCPRCRQAKQERVQEFVDKVKEFGRDSYLDPDEEAQLLALQQKLALTSGDISKVQADLAKLRWKTKRADIEEFRAKYVEVAADGRLDSNEEQEVQQLKRKLRLSDEDVAATLQDLSHLRLLTAIQDGNLPVVRGPVSVVLRPGEVCHCAVGSSLIEEKTRTRFAGTDGGVSLGMGEKTSMNVGGFAGQTVEETYRATTDHGGLYVTDTRVVFVGQSKSFTYPINHIVNVRPYTDAVQFFKENDSQPKWFTVDEPWLSMMVALLVNRLIAGTPGDRPHAPVSRPPQAASSSEPSPISNQLAPTVAFAVYLAAVWPVLQGLMAAMETFANSLGKPLPLSPEDSGKLAQARMTIATGEAQLTAIDTPGPVESAQKHFLTYTKLVKLGFDLSMDGISKIDVDTAHRGMEVLEQSRTEMSQGLAALKTAEASL